VQYRKQSGILSKVLITFSVLVFVFIALQNPRIELLIENLSKPELFSDHLQDGSMFSRIHIWNAGTDIIKKHFVFGVGPGDTSTELLNRYIAHHYIDPVLRNSNAHNQYLETFIDLGFVGFLLLFGSIISPFFVSIEKRNIVFQVFLFIIGFNFLFESVLNMQAGVVFFSFFYSLFSILKKKDKLNLEL
ncbi:MAG: O-antigen ligase family protein, partial [Bacteroidales bacterium]|nr:O-antigen ligase family protein [Bacteroidales bacterium]